MMDSNLTTFLQALAYIGIFIGLLGSVAPFVPGPVLIWFSVLLWTWADGFQRLGWPSLVVLGLIAVVAEVSDLLLTAAGARHSGASWRSMLAAALGAVAGFLVFNLPGALIGAVGGMMLWEARRQGGDWQLAWQSSRGALLGYLASVILKVMLAFLMVAIFIWQAAMGR